MEKSCIWNFNYANNASRLPKSWEEFCEMYPIKREEYFVSSASVIANTLSRKGDNSERLVNSDSNVLPDHATAEAVLTLCQLIQLRNCYNGDWVPDWNDTSVKHTIEFESDRIFENYSKTFPQILYFKTKDLRDEFLRNFRDLVEKLEPLYGIKEGGQE